MSVSTPPVWFMEQMGVLVSAYPTWKPTETTFRVYFAALSDIDQESFARAVTAHMRQSRYHPTIADLLEFSRPIGTTATEAWDEMRRHRTRRAQERYNANQTQPNWSSEAVRRAAEAVAWDDPDWLSEQIPTIRAQFERHYNSLASKTAGIDARQEAGSLAPNVRRALGGDGPRKLMGGAE